MSLNRVTVSGRLVNDVELRKTPQDVSVATARIAVENDFKNKETGNRDASFFTVVAWRQSADFFAEHFGKGSPLIVDGKLQSRQYTDKGGNNRTAVEIIADNFYFAGNKPFGDAAGEVPGKATTKKVAPAEPAEDPDDMPF